MPAEFSLLPLGPFGKYRHGCNLPERLTRFSLLPLAFSSKHFPFACTSNFLNLFLISFDLVLQHSKNMLSLRTQVSGHGEMDDIPTE